MKLMKNHQDYSHWLQKEFLIPEDNQKILILSEENILKYDLQY